MTPDYTAEARALLCGIPCGKEHGRNCPARDHDAVARVAARLEELHQRIATMAALAGEPVPNVQTYTTTGSAALANKEENGG